MNCQGTIAATSGGSINLNGGVTVSGFGNVSLGYGSFTVNDSLSGIAAGSLSAFTGYVGSSGTGTFNQSGGTNNLGSGNLILGNSAGSSGSYNLGGSGVISAGTESIGSSGTGTFNQSGGTNIVMRMLSFGVSGTYNLTGGILLVSGIQGTGTFDVGGGTLKARSGFSTSQPMTLTGSGEGATFDTAGYAVTLSGSLSGPGSLTKVDSGTLTLTGSNTYTGPTTINQGMLVVDGWLTSSAFTVNGGTLGGTGYLSGGTVNAGGTLAPGDALGVLHLGGNLVLASSAALDYELGANGYDQLVLSGSAALNGTLNVNLVGGFTPSAGESFDLINGRLTGSFSQITLPPLTNGLSWDTSSLYTTGTISIVPEPSTLALLGVGGIGLLGCDWRRRRRLRLRVF